MLRVVITGGIACGKSEVGRLLAATGVPVLDTDAVAHALMRKGTPVFAAVCQAFGPAALGADGELDRARLGALVFADAAARERLNARVHPAIWDATRAWLDDRAQAGAPLAVVQAPLLYEAGFGDRWDAVVCVACASATQLRRLAARGLDPAAAAQRLAAQMDLALKMERADYVIWNEDGFESLREQVTAVFESIRES